MSISLENVLRDVVQREIQAQLAPLNRAVGRMAERLDALDMIREVTKRLASLSSRLGSIAGVRTPTLAPEPVGRGRGRRGRASVEAAPRARAAAAGTRARAAGTSGAARACAVVGCKRPSRSKGYCSAHYQKLRLLIRTGRRPAQWVDDAAPQSVREVKLPRGRAASQALKQASLPLEPAEPPKPKAWVRKKGAGGMVSLH